MALPLVFLLDDLSGDATRALIAHHVADMRANSPPGKTFALDFSRLRAPDVWFWTAWSGRELAGCGALRQLDTRNGELKSMRVADAFLRQGVGKAILDHLIGEARVRKIETLWLETGSAPAFTPAIRLYEGAGFVACGPFDGYVDNEFSVFMTRPV